jgi:hypothetical protein
LSSDFDWNPDEKEWFTLLTLSFDVSKAKRLIMAGPRPLVMVPVDKDTAECGLIGVREDRLKELDMSFPIIVASLNEEYKRQLGNGYMLIDGWHRYRRASREGITELPGVKLTVEETLEVMKWRMGQPNWAKRERRLREANRATRKRRPRKAKAAGKRGRARGAEEGRGRGADEEALPR